MQPDISMALNSEINKMHNKERLKAKPKSLFPKSQMKEKEKKNFPSQEIQDAIQRLLQNSLKMQKDVNPEGLINTLPLNLQSATEIASIASVHAIHIEEIFKEMVGAISHCMDSGDQQTTITLNSPEFSKSLFYGTKITITEFSTAPKIYNIELSTSPEAIEIFQMSASELMAAFRNGKFNFEVNRIDTQLADKPTVQKGKVPPVDKDKGRNL